MPPGGESEARRTEDPRFAPGFFKPVDYSSRTRYRPPPSAYLRLQWLGTVLTRLGLSPAYVVTLEVVGRRSSRIRRTNLVRVTHERDDYLVALAGEAEWVRNVRGADGRVVLSRRRRYPAVLVEIPTDERAPIIRAYMLRSGRCADSKAVINEARYYFGVRAAPSLESLDEIGRIARHYPVFRIAYDLSQGP